MRSAALALLVAALAALAGCGDSQDDAAEAAARAFGDALRAGDAPAACRLLAPRTREELERSAGSRCRQALPASDVVALDAVTSTERYGRQAAVRLRGPAGRTDTWFLSRFDDRWLVVAAGCEPRAELPATCEVEGPS